MRRALTILIAFLQGSSASNTDRFNYRETEGQDYGPSQWNLVGCDDVGECEGWPDSWELGIGWKLETNNCVWCPETGNSCGLHRSSPINLERTPSTTGHDTECYDYHWMAYQDGSCNWHDIVKNGYSKDSNNFHIRRHALQIQQPIDEQGQLACDSTFGRLFPRLDYSKGFPDWWFLSHTEITVPSEHTQNGKHYDAEVHLEHFYSKDHVRQLGTVAIFLQADLDRQRWDFLDKLICQWREVEELTRNECGLESVPPYPGCRNPTRPATVIHPPETDPYPFIDCDSIENSQRICKPTSCCEKERSTSRYCENEVYGRYGDETVGSICWWCCPGKLLAPADGEPTASPWHQVMENPSSYPSIPPSNEEGPSDAPTVEVGVSVGPSMSIPTHSTTPVVLSSAGPSQVSTSLNRPSNPPSKSVSPVVCADYKSHPDINLRRICKTGGCCDATRSATNHCHFVYKFFGDQMSSICSDCCNPSKTLAEAPVLHEEYNPIECTEVDNPFRICKPRSCCEEIRSTSSYCKATYEKYGDDMGSICWYCCSEPKQVDRSVLSTVSVTEISGGYSFPNSAAFLRSPASSTSPSHVTSFHPSDAAMTSIEASTPIATAPVIDSLFPSVAPSVALPTSSGSPLLITTVATSAFAPFSVQDNSPSGSNLPSALPSQVPSTIQEVYYSEVPSKGTGSSTMENTFSCDTYRGLPEANFNRICSDQYHGCCNAERSETDFCHRVYQAYGDTMDRACLECCRKELAPPPKENPKYPPINCTIAYNTPRICRSCCPSTSSPSAYCQVVYQNYTSLMGSICWNCCSKPMEFTHEFIISSKSSTLYRASSLETGVGGEAYSPAKSSPVRSLLRSTSYVNPQSDGESRVAELDMALPLASGERHRDPSYEMQKELRRLDVLGTGDNYIDVPYSPYEWMREVKTEYYYRYKGSQMVPPCFETVHYRVMKDPIRIHPDQLAELERLLAWRIAPKGSALDECQRDTAGKVRPGGNAVDLNRPVQSYSNIHSKVFCECGDWDSKFKEDRDWCELDKETRFNSHPYNFDSKGKY